MISGRLPGVVAAGAAHIEPPPLPTMTKSKLSSQSWALLISALMRAIASYGGTLCPRASYCISERRSSILMGMFRSDLLQGKKILVTGGGTGLGKSIARRYLQLGAEVVICGRRADVLDTTARELAAETGGRTAGVQCDRPDGEHGESMI